MILGFKHKNLNRQPKTAFLAAARQNFSAAEGPHSLTETMAAGSFSFFWLIGSFGHINLLCYLIRKIRPGQTPLFYPPLFHTLCTFRVEEGIFCSPFLWYIQR
jgi:hypothetical protein